MARHQNLALFAGTLLLLPLTNCGCDDDNFDKVAPKIEIVPEPSDSGEICKEDRFRKCKHNFGAVEIGTGKFLKFVIANPSPVELKIDKIKFSDDTNTDVFSINGKVPEIVEAEANQVESVVVTVQYTPNVENSPDDPVRGKLIIVSDAANLEPKEDVVIDLEGYGVDTGSPDMVVTPDECDFGQVGAGVKAFCDVTIENIGQKDLVIHTIGFTAETPFPTVFNSETIFPPETYIAPGTGTSIRLSATPQAAETYTGAMTLTSNDPDQAELELPLSVTGAEAPTAVAEVKSINGVPNSSPSPLVAPLDDVVLTAENSVASNVTETITEWQWEITQRPPESSVTLTTPTAETTGFTFSSANGNIQGIDVAGNFIIKLTVTDSFGLVSTNTAEVSLNSIPQDSLHVQLTWDSPSYDFDLHVIKDSGAYCSANSCYYGNCNASGKTGPEWDGIQGATDGDPSLDIDDLSGYGPENINIDFPVAADYGIAVHAYSFTVSDTVYATVKVFINGALSFENSRAMATGRDFWEVAEVQWNNGAGILIPIDSYESGWSCPFGF